MFNTTLLRIRTLSFSFPTHFFRYKIFALRCPSLKQVFISIPPHRHLVPLLECFETKTYLYLVLQQAKLGDLFQNIKTKLIAEESLKCLMRQLVLALDHMHRHRYIHGDVKPENVLLLPTEHEDRPHILLASLIPP